MMHRRFFALFTAGLLAAFSVHIASAQQPAPIRLSLAKSFVPDQPQILIDIFLSEFKAVTKTVTGLNSDMSAKLTPAEIAEKLNNQELDFGILYAHEFAWAQKKYPDLRPLLIAATKKLDKRAHIIVSKDSPAKSIADLRGKKFDLPLGTKEYCRIYLEKVCADKDFFSSITKSNSQIAALDQVARNGAEATIVDTPWLEFYKDVKGPVFDKNLRVLQQSEVVPPSVVVYKPGTLPKATVDRVRDGLRKVHTSVRGRARTSSRSRRCRKITTGAWTRC
jgi:ABC-type phosphate/phosphonate transport system substrate-binding protein